MEMEEESSRESVEVLISVPGDVSVQGLYDAMASIRAKVVGVE